MSLPTGTLTFLFTDIEASTRLLQQLGDAAYAHVLADHRRLLRIAFAERDGQELETQGDGFLLAFPRARDAVLAAVEAQRKIFNYPWPTGVSVRVRIGIHTGEPIAGVEGYVGVDIHRAARICSAGHGGQILLSQTTRDLVAESVPEGVSLRDLGEHRLKDLAHAQHLFQVVVPDLPGNYPALKTFDLLANNLPLQLTSFVGREHEKEEVRRLLSTSRLLTLTGVGGVGKTRLALQLAAEVLDDFKDGVWLVEFASLSVTDLVSQAVSSVLQVREQPGQELLTTLSNNLRPKHVLLVLDNCEHLVVACGQLADTLLRMCPHLKILATSRERLGIAGEATWTVPPLSLPDPRESPSLEQLQTYEAVTLFAERALVVSPTFVITDQNAPAVMTLCHELDGLPLAIELAAARLRAIPVEEVAGRLADRFRLLTGGDRTALPRRQTLRAAMDWSHELLSQEERVLLRRLSVFAGGFTLEAAEMVCIWDDREGLDIVDLLTNLVDKSLVVPRTEDGKGRYELLETVRQYAREKLLEANEEPKVRERHRDWCLEFAERMEVKRWEPNQAVGLDRLETEHDNLREGLAWSVAAMEAEPALRLAVAIGWLWQIRGYWSEARKWLKAALSISRSPDPHLRARALFWAARFAQLQSDYVAERLLREESLAIFREVGSKQDIALVLDDLGVSLHRQKDYAAAGSVYQESLSIFREMNMKERMGWLLMHLAELAKDQGDLMGARSRAEESLALCREFGFQRGIAYSLGVLAAVEERQGEYTAARSLREKELAILREVGDKDGVGLTLIQLAGLARDQGDYAVARRLFEESLAIYRELSGRTGTAWALRGLGTLARAQGDLSAVRPLYEESLSIFREVGGKRGIGWVLNSLGSLWCLQGDWGAASPLYEESLAIFREFGDRQGIGYALSGLSEVERSQSHYGRAATVLSEALSLLKNSWDKPLAVVCLEGFGYLAAAEGQMERAARLFAAAMAAREAMGTPVPPSIRADYDQTIASTHGGLGETAFTAAWAEGRAMTVEQAIEYVLTVDS